MNPEMFTLEMVDWQFFCTFTFKSLKVPEAVYVKMFFATIGDQAQNLGVHFSKILWVLRREKGEITGRPHFHALIAGLPASASTVATSFSFMKIWERHGGGQSRVRVYDSSLTGVEYVLKGANEAWSLAGANHYELGKFGHSCDVTLSMSLIRHVQNRKRFGHRDRDGLFRHTNKAGVDNSPALLKNGNFRLDEEDRYAGRTVQRVVDRLG